MNITETFLTMVVIFLLIPFLFKHLSESKKMKKNKTDEFIIHRIARSIGYFYQSKYSAEGKNRIRDTIEIIKILRIEIK